MTDEHSFEGASRYDLSLEQRKAEEAGDAVLLAFIEKEIARRSESERLSVQVRNALRSLRPSLLATLSMSAPLVGLGLASLFPRQTELQLTAFAWVSIAGMSIAVISLLLRERPLYAALLGIAANVPGAWLCLLGASIYLSPGGWMH